MRKISLLILFLGLQTVSVTAQNDSESELVIIRVLEYISGTTKEIYPAIHITENDGSYRVVELEKYTKRYLLNPTDNQKKIHLELKSYLDKGYDIAGHSKGEVGINLGWFEDYVLLKK